MAPKTRSAQEVDEAALNLMLMADPDWNSPDADEDKEKESQEFNQETSDQKTEHAKTLLSFSQAAMVHSTRSQSLSVTQSQSVPPTPQQSVSETSSQTALTTPSQTISAAASQAASATPLQRNLATNDSSSNSATTPSLTAASLAILTVEQRALQQRRLAMTSHERATLDLKAYSHYDLNNNQIGILWQTKNENRTYRQTQRRNGAARLRAGTTTGLKFPRRHRA